MVEKRNCSFCGNAIEPGTGKMYIRKDGTIYTFCSNKCKKNRVDLGRVPRRTRWTTRYAELKAGTLKRKIGDESPEEDEKEEDAPSEKSEPKKKVKPKPRKSAAPPKKEKAEPKPPKAEEPKAKEKATPEEPAPEPEPASEDATASEEPAPSKDGEEKKE